MIACNYCKMLCLFFSNCLFAVCFCYCCSCCFFCNFPKENESAGVDFGPEDRAVAAAEVVLLLVVVLDFVPVS